MARFFYFLVIATAFLVPGSAVIAPLFLATLAGALGVVALAMALRNGWSLGIPRTVATPLLVVLTWAAIGSLWAVDASQALTTTGRLLVSTFLGLVMVSVTPRINEPTRRAITRALLAGSSLALAILLVEYLSGNWASALLSMAKGQEPIAHAYKSQFNRGTTVLAMLIWPLACLMVGYGNRKAAILVVTTAALTLAVGDSLSARIAFLAGVMVFAVAIVSGRAVVILLRTAIIAWIAILPLALTQIPAPPQSVRLLPWLPSSSHARLAIWHFTVDAIAQRPVLGWGMDSSRSLPGGKEVFDFPWIVDGQEKGTLSGEWMPLHPHNAALQWWVELGLPGALAMAIMMWILAGRIGGLTASRPWASAAMTSAMSISAVSYGFWQGWWQAALWIVAALSVLAARATPSSDDAMP